MKHIAVHGNSTRLPDNFVNYKLCSECVRPHKMHHHFLELDYHIVDFALKFHRRMFVNILSKLSNFPSRHRLVLADLQLERISDFDTTKNKVNRYFQRTKR